ncbi:hypothetical protein BJY52DRAFT_1184959 [Lactarius psammicola]|nr:hypothetical protein BJY52DRAFT_1184959 [Lactarius psammicola]
METFSPLSEIRTSSSGTGRPEIGGLKSQASLLYDPPLTTSAPCCAFLDDRHIIFTHYNPSRERTISFQVTTLPEGGSPLPPSSYRFALNLPMLSPPYFTELHMDTLRPNPPGSYGRGLFYTDPRRKLLALELGAITVEGFTAVFTLHTLYVPHDAFLSHTRLVTVPNVAHSRYLGLHKVCGMQALSEPPILLDRGILRILDYRPFRSPPVAEQDDGNDEEVHSLPDSSSGGSMGGSTRASSACPAKRQPEHQGLRQMPPPPPPPPTPPDRSIPYSVKDIPLPKELKSDSVRCVLCEDVVVLFEVGIVHLIPALPTIQLRSFLWAAPNNPAKG